MYKIFTILLFTLFIHSTNFAQPIDRVEGSLFPASTRPDTLYFSGRNLSESAQFTLLTLAGIVARTKPEIIIYNYFHEEIIRDSKLGIPILYTYSDNIKGFLQHYSKRLDGYILCDPKSASAHVAASLSGILNAVAVPTDLEAAAKSAGLTMVLDVTGKDEAWALENYKDKFNKNVAFYQPYRDWVGLADYVAYTGGFRFFDEKLETGSALSDSVFSFLNPGAMFYGWWVSENGTIKKISEKGFKLIPGGLKNASTFTNIDVPPVKQKEPVKPYKVVPNVHTVCFVLSDGDHIGWVAGAGYWDPVIFKNENQCRINMGFTISPNLTELTPLIYSDLINGLQTTQEGRNIAVAGPSGLAYYFPSLSPNNPDHCAQLNKYMRKADMSIVNIIDEDIKTTTREDYLKQSNIDALFYYTYGEQYQGMHGSINWYKGKPSIGGRFALWGNGENSDPLLRDRIRQDMVSLLNKQSTNINSSAGYSLIPVHVWTMKPDDVLDIVLKLGPNVRVVAPDEFVWLIKKNIGKLPMGDGMGLKGEYFKGSNFDTLVNVRIDQKIDFDWKTGRPDKLTGSNQFSVRWTGQVQALYSEQYTFYIASNAGTKLTINGKVLIDSLSANDLSLKHDTITLKAGEKFDIAIEYRKETGNASCLLEWESASQLRQIVPHTQLFAQPVSATGVVTVYKESDMKGFSAGLGIGTFTTSQLNDLGIQKNDISSLKLMEGFKAIVYSADNFSGDSLVFTTSENSLSKFLIPGNTSSWDNTIASVKIKANGDTGLAGAYRLKNLASNYFLDVRGGSSAFGDGTNIQQFSSTGAYNQVFQFIHLGDGVYTILARHSKSVLSFAGMGFEENSNVYQWKDFGSENQKFIVVPSGENTYKFISTYTGMVVNAASNGKEANVQMNSNLDQDLGKWVFFMTQNREGSGNGLLADYYNGTGFSLLKYTRIDPQVYFNWGSSSPGAPVTVDNFSVRWTGYVEPRYSGLYKFYITSDNGRRLWVNDELIIDKWINDWDSTYTGTVYLKAQTKYPIKLEYFEVNGGANIRLEWSNTYETREIIPKSQLYSELTVGIKTLEKNDDIFPYPNPVDDRLYLEGVEKPVAIEIYNLQGSLIVKTLDTSVNTKQLLPGLYLLTLKIDGRPLSFKFVKQ